MEKPKSYDEYLKNKPIIFGVIILFLLIGSSVIYTKAVNKKKLSYEVDFDELYCENNQGHEIDFAKLKEGSLLIHNRYNIKAVTYYVFINKIKGRTYTYTMIGSEGFIRHEEEAFVICNFKDWKVVKY